MEPSKGFELQTAPCLSEHTSDVVVFLEVKGFEEVQARQLIGYESRQTVRIQVPTSKQREFNLMELTGS